MTITIQHFFDPDTSTFSYVVSDPRTSEAAVIDSVLDYDQDAGRTSTKGADTIIDYIREKNLKPVWIMDTHVHADHLTASGYIQEQLGGKTVIGDHIKDVLNFWIPLFNIADDTPRDGSQFDVLLGDGEVLKLGNIEIKAINTPGHTPACMCYLIEDAVFVGDTLFMPDVGTARVDFPGGDAAVQYDSIQRILSLPDETRLFMCHDYPPAGREVTHMTTVAEEKKNNILINQNISREEYIDIRTKRDVGKKVPRNLLPSIQVNIRAGKLGKAEKNGINYMKIPLNKL